MLRRGAEPTKIKKKKVPAKSILEPQVCYVSRVISYSSQYNSTGWSANQVIGEPKVYPRYGDIQGSWAQANCSANEYLQLEFPKALYIDKISIYETYNCGAVTGIGAWNPDTNSYVSIYHGAPTVCSHSRIFEPQIEALSFKCNRLRLDIDCTASGTWCEIDAVKITGREQNLPPVPPNSLSKDMYKLVNSQTFSDVCFIVDKKKVPAHRAILVARSNYFNAMFTGKMKESDMDEIVLEDVKYETFIPMLEFLYTGELSCSPVVAIEMLKLADMFGMEDLKLTCMSRVPEHLSIDTVIGVLNAVSEGDSLSSIRELCYDFIAKNYVAVTSSEEFQSLPKEHILEIVQLTASRLQL